jgi:surface protein
MTSGLTFTASGTPVPPFTSGNLVMTFNTALATTNPGNVYLPLGGQYGGAVNALIDWGDGNTTLANIANIYSHTYATTGNYQVGITGAVSAYGYQFGSGENEPLVSVDSWDDGLGLTNMFSAFYFANNLIAVPNTLPSTVHFLNSAFFGANTFNQDLDGWDTSNVIGWDNIFQGASAFNGNISNWNTSLAQSMAYLFRDASAFNSNISSWNVSNVFDMTDMFYNATVFDQNLSGWCVTLVPSEPTNFAANSALANGNYPVWGTCPP